MCGRRLAGAYGAKIFREQGAEALDRLAVAGAATLGDPAWPLAGASRPEVLILSFECDYSYLPHQVVAAIPVYACIIDALLRRRV